MGGSGMVMTTLEARVDEARWTDLTGAYADAILEPEPGMVATWLVQGRAEPALWRIVTLWRDQEALAAMRSSGTPRGVRIFGAAGAEPELLVASVRLAGGA